MKIKRFSVGTLVLAASFALSLQPISAQTRIKFSECIKGPLRMLDDAHPSRCGIGGGGGTGGGSTGGGTSTSAAAFSKSRSGTKTKWFGKGKFGVAVGSDYNVNGSVKNAKVAAGAKPFLKGKVFGRSFTIIGLDAKLGNYNNYDWNSQQANQKFDQHGISKWKWYGAVRPFGITVGFGKKNFLSKEGSLTKGHVLYSWGKYYKKTLWSVTVVVVVVPVTFTTGIFGFVEFKPTLSSHGITELSLSLTPKAGFGVFAEGGVNLLLIRGGVGVRLSLIEGYGGLRLTVNSFPGIASVYLVSYLDILKGKVYAFVDRWGFKFCCRFRWKRWGELNIFDWAGRKARQLAGKEKEWTYSQHKSGGFKMVWSIEKTVENAKWDEKEQMFIYEGPYENGLPADVRGHGADVYQFNLVQDWKNKHFSWMGKEQKKELWSHRFYDYQKVMNNIHKALDN